MIKKKKKLRKEYDKKLIDLMESTKNDWMIQSQLNKLSFEKSDDLQAITQLAKAKYFFLFHEAKVRKISINK
ncbi:YaaL family protein [Lederbergia wuyishanensis]|uniref:tRNA(His) 5'-end guanylyltransferase n=1 Tax=Lederbergia wuyishanensis TaxID=1347903 RepID=A0ABU0DAU3_9BACI|nr:YaaL family protein [Lederbergia wuyishanensis]MCJ8009987.1 YaaL family protein [Lederbergia wuyishanensis]MDQ0345500.1 tRNA(His) 5'-end guanylyltransferase [Lederbergia wuyishanensis]